MTWMPLSEPFRNCTVGKMLQDHWNKHRLYLKSVVTFLPYLPAHGRFDSGQMFEMFYGTVVDGQRRVVEGIYAARVQVRTTHPTLDGRG